MLLMMIFCYLKLDFLSWISAWLNEDVEPGWTAERESRRMGNVWHYVSATQAHIKTKHLFAIAQFLREHVKKVQTLTCFKRMLLLFLFSESNEVSFEFVHIAADTFSYSFLQGCSIQKSYPIRHIQMKTSCSFLFKTVLNVTQERSEMPQTFPLDISFCLRRFGKMEYKHFL